MFALIEFAGKQFKIEEGKTIKVPYINEKVGTKVVLNNILFMDDGKTKLVGNPSIKGLSVNSEIDSHGRERKIVVFKFKRRKGHQKKNSHRQEFTLLKIGKISKTTKKTIDSKSKGNNQKKVATKKPATKKVVAKKTATKKPATKKVVAKKKTSTKE